VNVTGTQPFELPPLRDATDLFSIRVEATGAEVRKVDITLTYLTYSARWTPNWDLQLQPETNAVICRCRSSTTSR